MLLYGVGNHSPEQFLSWSIKEHGLSEKDITVVPVNAKLSKEKVKKYNRVILLITYADFLRNAKLINSPEFNKKIFVMFSTPFRLFEHAGITPLDCAESTVNRGIGYRLSKDFNVNDFKLKVAKTHRKDKVKSRPKYLPRLVDNVYSETTLLSSLMTVVYTIKGTVNQKPVTLAIAKWLKSSGSESDLDKLLARIASEFGVIVKVQDKLREVLLSEMGDNVSNAMADISKTKAEGKSVNYTSLEKKHDVSAYDLRYLLKIIDNSVKYASQEKKSIDELARRDS